MKTFIKSKHDKIKLLDWKLNKYLYSGSISKHFYKKSIDSSLNEISLGIVNFYLNIFVINPLISLLYHGVNPNKISKYRIPQLLIIILPKLHTSFFSEYDAYRKHSGDMYKGVPT